MCVLHLDAAELDSFAKDSNLAAPKCKSVPAKSAKLGAFGGDVIAKESSSAAPKYEIFIARPAKCAKI